MDAIACPECGEEERLEGRPASGDRTFLCCNACGNGWLRDLGKKCVHCGSDQLRYTPMPVWSGGRGTMQTPAGTREAYTCERCGSTDATRKRDEPGGEAPASR